MKKKEEIKVYRQCVGALIYNPITKKILLFQRIDRPNSWQLPQGGVEGDEAPDMALLREVEEETGIGRNKLSIVLCAPRQFKYDIPTAKLPKSWGGKYCGQSVTFFLLHFTGSDNDIKLNLSKRPEFDRFKWVMFESFLNEVMHIKKNLYSDMFDCFAEIIKLDQNLLSNVLFSNNETAS